MPQEHFMGRDGFVWWFGTIENRMDPLQLGRAQVRILGWHAEDTVALPTEDLPWAHPVLPLNADTPKSPREGVWVVGFFRDGIAGQEPIMLGIMPHIPAPSTE